MWNKKKFPMKYSLNNEHDDYFTQIYSDFDVQKAYLYIFINYFESKLRKLSFFNLSFGKKKK